MLGLPGGAGKRILNPEARMTDWLDFLFPRDCAATGEALGGETPGHLGARGIAALPRIGDPRCLRCGQPFFGVLLAGRACPRCADMAEGFGRAVCAFRSRDLARELIHRAKYRGEPQLIDDLCRAAAGDPVFARHLAGSTLVPVPLHPTRLRERGYDQAARAAGMLAGLIPGCRAGHLLVRRRRTRQQARLGRRERQENLDDAFALAPGSRPDAAVRLVLVDDVLTTGATLASAARVLVAAGARSVDAAALAHG